MTGEQAPDEAPARGSRRPGAGVAVVLGAAGLLFVASGSTAAGTDLRGETGDLATVVVEERDRAARGDEALDALRSDVEQLATTAAAGDTTVAEIERAAEATGMAAGMQPVSGPAVVVTLDDADPASPKAVRARSNDDLVVHQQDVQAVVNALWLGGAEAMMLMDQRVISTSAVRCVGNTLSLQGRPYSPPYVVTAIGDVDGMLDALDDSDTVQLYLDYVDAYGLGWSLSSGSEVEMPAFSGPLELQHARVPGV